VRNSDPLAEDVTQEVFVHLWQHPEQFDHSEGTLRSWLGMLAQRRSVNRVRSERPLARRETVPETPERADNPTDDYLAASWLSGWVRQAMNERPPEQRQTIVVAYYGGRTYRQLAEELGIPAGTVKSRMRTALRQLREMMDAEHPTSGGQTVSLRP
jgi:RNA polymerase sigma factor (sigma-70 family)